MSVSNEKVRAAFTINGEGQTADPASSSECVGGFTEDSLTRFKMDEDSGHSRNQIRALAEGRTSRCRRTDRRMDRRNRAGRAGDPDREMKEQRRRGGGGGKNNHAALRPRRPSRLQRPLVHRTELRALCRDAHTCWRRLWCWRAHHHSAG